MKMHRGFIGLGLLLAGVLAASRTGEGAPNATSAAAAAAAAASGTEQASASASGTAPASAYSPLVGDAVKGKETFTQYCSICHGVGAKGFIGPHIAGIDWTAPGLIAIVRGGVGGYGSMPAFNAEAVTDTNIADIAAYLVSLAPGSTSKSTTTTAMTSATATRGVAVVGSPAAASTSAPATSTSAPAATSTSSSVSRAASLAAGDPVHGHDVYLANCAACHGANAQGGVGPALRGEKNRKDTVAAIAWIKNPKLPMPKLYPSVISEKDVEDVAAYVESL